MRCVVTGAAGFIGSHLVEQLLSDGHEVVGVDAFTDFYDPGLKRRNLAAARDYDAFELLEGDLTGLDLRAVLEGAGAVFHLAGRPGVQSSWGDGLPACVHANVEATRRLLEAAQRITPAPRVVLASSSSVYGRAARFPIREDDPVTPVSPYGLTKLAAERAAHAAFERGAVPVVVLRYFSVFGPRQRPDMAFARFIAAARAARRVTVHGSGAQVRDFTAVADVVEATLAASARGITGRTYNIAGGCPSSLLDALDVLSEVLGARLAVAHSRPVPGDPPRTHADTGRALRELAWRPRVTLREGLAAQLARPALAAAA